ncbi:MAG: dihydrolipoamide dehydrogenase [Legionellaceae bacterium]|nr:dihydrolipoamide dehydrogenase [Legionellaceae bacterium]
MLNPTLCIIGAGSGGLSLAAGAVQMGASVVLIENNKMGGDCLNYGCVPSKALIAAAQVAHTMESATSFGIKSITPQVDYSKIRAHIRRVQAQIAPNDSVERFTRLGVNVIKGSPKFVDSHTLKINDSTIKAKYFVIATGSTAAVPPIPGLEKTPYLTNETIFDLDERPNKLLVVGGGPIGCEMAQAHAQLGTPVTQLVAGSILPKDDPGFVEYIRKSFSKNNIELIEFIKSISKVESQHNDIIVYYEAAGKTHSIKGSHLLIATGRRGNIDDLELDKAKVKTNQHSILVDKRLRSSNKRIFAIGDVTGRFQFTHVANYHAGIVIRNTLFKLPAKVDYRAVPWVTYTQPELAHVGMSKKEAKKRFKKPRIIEMTFSENDRAQTQREVDGKIRIITQPNGIVIGCDIVGIHAGELLLPWTIAIQHKLHISKIATSIAPYPTLSEISKRVAGNYYTPSLFSKKTKFIVRLLDKLF